MRKRTDGNKASYNENLDYVTGELPQHLKIIFLLLRYARIEGLSRGLHKFVHLIDMARLELHSQIEKAMTDLDQPEGGDENV